MYEIIFLLALGLIWIVFASIKDIKSREVPNWLSFSLIVFALGFRFFYGLFSGEDFSLFYQGLIGFGIFFIFGNIFYHLKLFAGGDAKLMIALGSVFPLFSDFSSNLKVYMLFLFLFFLSGAIYGLVITISLSFRHFRAFRKDFFKRIGKNKLIIGSGMFFGIVLFVLGFYDIVFLGFGILLFIFPLLFFYAKAVDDVCMIRNVAVKDLTEGDWLVNNVKVRKKIIKSTWAGLSKRDIDLIKKKYKFIKIRQGIPFVPVFLIAFLILIYLWNKGLWYPLW